MSDPHSVFLVISALVTVVGLILLITVAKLNPFLTLLVASLFLAVVTGMPPITVVHSFEAGVGGTLGHIAVIVALGTMLGKMMAESGAADRLLTRLIRHFRREAHSLGDVGDRPYGWPAGFFSSRLRAAHSDCIYRGAANRDLTGAGGTADVGRPFGGPWTGAAASGGLLAVAIYKADVGRTILYALLVGIPTALSPVRSMQS